jgi:hypothetical protein
VPSQVATYEKVGSLLWAVETPDLNLGTVGQQFDVLPLSHHAFSLEKTALFPKLRNISMNKGSNALSFSNEDKFKHF